MAERNHPNPLRPDATQGDRELFNVLMKIMESLHIEFPEIPIAALEKYIELHFVVAGSPTQDRRAYCKLALDLFDAKTKQEGLYIG